LCFKIIDLSYWSSENYILSCFVSCIDKWILNLFLHRLEFMVLCRFWKQWIGTLWNLNFYSLRLLFSLLLLFTSRINLSSGSSYLTSLRQAIYKLLCQPFYFPFREHTQTFLSATGVILSWRVLFPFIFFVLFAYSYTFLSDRAMLL